MNTDYESFLFSGKSDYRPLSNKINQEFEYLIHFIEEEDIFSNKSYSKEYIQHVESLSSKKFKVTNDPSGLKNWWCSVGEVEHDRVLHSKITSTNFCIEQGVEKEALLVDHKTFSPKENQLYKMPGELSGRGHLIWSRDQRKIEKLIDKGETLIEEPIRERVLDFSTLVLGRNDYIVYENIVDEKFQYKGTRLLKPRINLDQSYFEFIDKTISYYCGLGASFPFSIDSYAYKQNDSLKIAPVCEVNPRKTMGFIAWKLKEFFKSEHASMLILPKRTIEHNSVKWLSPIGNRFQIAFLDASSSQDLLELEKEVLKP